MKAFCLILFILCLCHFQAKSEPNSHIEPVDEDQELVNIDDYFPKSQKSEKSKEFETNSDQKSDDSKQVSSVGSASLGISDDQSNQQQAPRKLKIEQNVKKDGDSDKDFAQTKIDQKSLGEVSDDSGSSIPIATSQNADLAQPAIPVQREQTSEVQKSALLKDSAATVQESSRDSDSVKVSQISQSSADDSEKNSDKKTDKKVDTPFKGNEYSSFETFEDNGKTQDIDGEIKTLISDEKHQRPTFKSHRQIGPRKTIINKMNSERMRRLRKAFEDFDKQDSHGHVVISINHPDGKDLFNDGMKKGFGFHDFSFPTFPSFPSFPKFAFPSFDFQNFPAFSHFSQDLENEGLKGNRVAVVVFRLDGTKEKEEAKEKIEVNPVIVSDETNESVNADDDSWSEFFDGNKLIDYRTYSNIILVVIGVLLMISGIRLCVLLSYDRSRRATVYQIDEKQLLFDDDSLSTKIKNEKS